MNGQAGKGDKPRPYDRKKFEDNYDQIFRKDKTQQQNGTIQQDTSGRP